VQTRLGYAIGADVSFSIYRRTLYQPYAVHISRNSSEIISGIFGKANQILGSSILPSLQILSSGLMLISIITVLLAIDLKITLAVFVGFVMIYTVILLLTRKRLSYNSQRISEKQDQVIKVLQEGLYGIRDVLIDGTQKNYCKAYLDADLPRRRATADNQIIAIAPKFGVEALGMVLIAVLAYTFSEKEGGIAGSLPTLGALALGAQRLLPIGQQIYSSFSIIRGGYASVQDAIDLLEQPLPEYIDTPILENIQFRDRIELENIDFRYDGSTRLVLDKINFIIPKGSRIGFIGTTGSGKSTLLDIIMGLLQPTNGSLSVDGILITDKNSRTWQKHIAHVPQDIFLADSTVAENIAFGVPYESIDFDRVRLVAQQAQIAETIELWELQYNTFVGERGVRLSGGQCQRIGIARALYKKVGVLVLDESTSALDTKTELSVMDAIDHICDEITVLMIAHRLSTLKQSDQIIELSGGKVVNVGDYKEIIDK